MPKKMSPPSYQQDDHYHHNHPKHHHLQQHPVKHETLAATTTTSSKRNNVYPRMSPSLLKVHRDSHMIKKPMSLPSVAASPTGSSFKPQQQQQQQQPQQRGPVIIYTHSPKVIHTNPRDFMALVQKLTGMSSNEAPSPTSIDSEPIVGPRMPAMSNTDHTQPYQAKVDGSKSMVSGNNNSSYSTDDTESSSVITDENCSSSTTTGDVVGQLNPYMGPPMFDLLPTPPNLPLFMPSTSTDTLCSSGDPAFYDYMDFHFPYDQIT